jgi:tungstate transport system substrate-binding protein
MFFKVKFYEGSFFMKRKLILLLALLFLLFISITGCKAKVQTSIILATTTSTEDSGLLSYLLPMFQKDTGIQVKVVAKGTGEALEIGKRGDADCLLVHAKDKELAFVNEGFGLERLEVMYNDFIILGPPSDPAKLKQEAFNDPVKALKLISNSNSKFASRGDESGTHTAEKKLWKDAGLSPSGQWYISAGKGMAEVLQMASEKEAYTLSDRATYLALKEKLKLNIVTEKSEKLYNQYSLIRLNFEKNKIKTKEADAFINWMLSEKSQKLIAEFGKEKFGQSLFVPNAKK